MELFIWILLGLFAGAAISLSVGTRSIQTLLTDVVLGSVGAIVGGLVLSIIAQPTAGFNLNIYSILIAALGAIVLVWLGKLVNTNES